DEGASPARPGARGRGPGLVRGPRPLLRPGRAVLPAARGDPRQPWRHPGRPARGGARAPRRRRGRSRLGGAQARALPPAPHGGRGRGDGGRDQTLDGGVLERRITEAVAALVTRLASRPTVLVFEDM